MMSIQEACDAFRVLLEEQQTRIANMNGEKVDFTTKAVVTIGVIDGDGIGPIITREATRVLEKLLADEIAAGSVVIKYIEGLTIENRIACGKAIPDDILAQIKTCDVLLKGPTTTPNGGTMESANVTIAENWICTPIAVRYLFPRRISTGCSTGKIRKASMSWAAEVLNCPVWLWILKLQRIWAPAELPAQPLNTQRITAKSMCPLLPRPIL